MNILLSAISSCEYVQLIFNKTYALLCCHSLLYITLQQASSIVKVAHYGKQQYLKKPGMGDQASMEDSLSFDKKEDYSFAEESYLVDDKVTNSQKPAVECTQTSLTNLGGSLHDLVLLKAEVCPSSIGNTNEDTWYV